MAIDASLDEINGILTLTHPNLDALSFNPDVPSDADKFVAWVKPIMPTDWFTPKYIARAADRGMTDTAYPSISINSHASNNALCALAGADLSPLRWRGNIWVDGVDAWDEFNWVGRELAIGQTRLAVRAPITRCNATKVDPDTGKVSIDTVSYTHLTLPTIYSV